MRQPRFSLWSLFVLTAVSAVVVWGAVTNLGVTLSLVFYGGMAGVLCFMALQRRINSRPLLERALALAEQDSLSFVFDQHTQTLHVSRGSMSAATGDALVDAVAIEAIEVGVPLSPEVESVLAEEYERAEGAAVPLWRRKRWLF